MKLDVLFSPLGLTPAEVQGRTVFVVDILRLSTTVCAALHHGARAVIPVPSTEEASAWPRRWAQRSCWRESALSPHPGLQLGNSPQEMIPDTVKGRPVIITTTNGTGAPPGRGPGCTVRPRRLLVAAAARRSGPDRDLVILCAGRDHRPRWTMVPCGQAGLSAGRCPAAAGTVTPDLPPSTWWGYGERWERPVGREQAVSWPRLVLNTWGWPPAPMPIRCWRSSTTGGVTASNPMTADHRATRITSRPDISPPSPRYARCVSWD